MTEATPSTAISALEQKVRDQAVEQLSERVNELFAPIFAKLDELSESEGLLHGVEIDGHTPHASDVLEKIMALVSDALQPAAEAAAIEALLAAADKILAAAQAPQEAV
ncbi:hypothetical protein [Pseudomonas sp. KCJK9000]|uniref:hypothetical protein n=1 Tax=Pseudomonas sp. KCJK9000 TaxID=3344566 RepID=UPI003906358C